MVCPECREATLLPAQPLLMGGAWVCTACSHTLPEAAVRQTVAGLLAELKQLTTNERYNVAKWLDLDERAAAQVHPQHEVRIEIAKWLGSILCRGPHSTNADYPREQLVRKMDLVRRQLTVLDIVDPGTRVEGAGGRGDRKRKKKRGGDGGDERA